MIFLCMFKEYGVEGAPSIAELASEQAYPGKEKIVNYLKTKGTVDMVSMCSPFDRVTGELIRDCWDMAHVCDGEFRWWSDLAYHVDKYNLRLPEEFEQHVMKGE